MTPHILLEPELLHLFADDAERDKLCVELVEVIQAIIRAECYMAIKDKTPDAYGLREIAPSAMDELCEKIAPKVSILTESHINSSVYSNKITSEVHINKNRLSVYLSPKYYTGLSSSLH